MYPPSRSIAALVALAAALVAAQQRALASDIDSWAANRRIGPVEVRAPFEPTEHGAVILAERLDRNGWQYRAVSFSNGGVVRYWSVPHDDGTYEVGELWTKSPQFGLRSIHVRSHKRDVLRRFPGSHYSPGSGPLRNTCGPLVALRPSAAYTQLYLSRRTKRVISIGISRFGEYTHGCPR